MGSGLSISPHDDEVRAFRRKTITLVLALWAVIYVILTMRAPFIEFLPNTRLMGRRAASVAVGAAITLALAVPVVRMGPRPFWLRVIVGLVLAMAGAVSHSVAHLAIMLRIWPFPELPPVADWLTLPQIVGWTTLWLSYHLAGLAAVVALIYHDEGRRHERSLAEMRVKAQEAQMRALRYQLNPHFLFNSLNSISSLLLDDRRDDAERMVHAVSEVYRATLASDAAHEVTLAREVEVQATYLDVERRRFSDRLDVEIDVPDALATASVPTLILQPLVENAVKHGVAQWSGCSRIAIRARRDGERLRVAVENLRFGPGDAAPSGAGAGFGVGLANVAGRLQSHFGDQASLFTSADGGGWLAEIVMPWRKP